MGWNTVVVVLNDATDAIEGDGNWGKTFARALKLFTTRRNRVDACVPAHGERMVFCNAAEIISHSHADGRQFVVVGGNTGWRITDDPEDGVPDDDIKQLERMLKERKRKQRDAQMSTMGE